MYDSLLLLIQIVHAVTLVGLLRRGPGVPHAYAWIVGSIFLLAIVARGFSLTGSSDASPVWGVIAITGSLATVVVPWLLEQLIRWAFSKGHVQFAVRASSLRSTLMLGSGLGRQQEVMDGLAVYERDGAQAALEHYRELAKSTDEPALLAAINEQIVSMLFVARRWQAGIDHYRRSFHETHALSRPALALGLVRAHGELGQLEDASRILRDIEAAEVATGPRASTLVNQARLSLLAFSGRTEIFSELEQADAWDRLGINLAVIRLFHGIALERAGRRPQAIEVLGQIESFSDKRDARIVESARAVLAELQAGGGSSEAIEIPSDSCADHLTEVEFHLRAAAAMPTATYANRAPIAARLALIPLLFGFWVRPWLEPSVLGRLHLGALSASEWTHGQWWRVFSAPWLQHDLTQLILDAYVLWVAGPVLERMLGRSRFFAIVIGSPALGLAVAALFWPQFAGAGASALVSLSVIVATLWALARFEHAFSNRRARRNLSIALALIGVAKLFGLRDPWSIGLAEATAVATVIVVSSLLAWLWVPQRLSEMAGASRALQAGGTALVLAWLASICGALALQADTQARWNGPDATQLHCHNARQQLTIDLPASFHLVSDEQVDSVFGDALPNWLPLRSGFRDDGIDWHEGLVQVVVQRGADEVELADLARTYAVLPSSASEWTQHSARTGDEWATYDLHMGGEIVTRVLQRRLRAVGDEPLAVAVFASPPTALSGLEQRYLRVLDSAGVVETPAPDPNSSSASAGAWHCRPEARPMPTEEATEAGPMIAPTAQ